LREEERRGRISEKREEKERGRGRKRIKHIESLTITKRYKKHQHMLIFWIIQL
jgi:hypothetical protein